MNIYKNPFSFRASERIESDEMFIELFCGEPLSLLEEKYDDNKLWDNMSYILSSPGAGKTTLMRLFSPSVLMKVTDNKPDIYRKLRKMEVKNGKNILRCGVYLMFDRAYGFLEDDELFGTRTQRKLFLALVNARTVLVTLKTLMWLARIKYTQLSEITYRPAEPFAEFGEIKESYTGEELLRWASRQEMAITSRIDSYEDDSAAVEGNSTLFSLKAMKAEYFTYKGNVLCKDFIFQFDDAHKLSAAQKEILHNEIAAVRLNATVWIAERLQGLSAAEILGDDNFEGRDYGVIRLDKSVTERSFNGMVRRVSTLRSNVSYDGIRFLECLANDVYVDYFKEYEAAAKEYLTKAEHCTSPQVFNEWFTAIRKMEPGRQKALYARALLMLLSRRNRFGEQMMLFPFGVDQMEPMLKDCLTLAEQIMPAEIRKVPQYYGVDAIMNLSSFNIEQFLNFASAMFSRLVANKVLNPTTYDLTAEVQDSIIAQRCEEKMTEVKNRNLKVYNFLTNVLKFCQKETFTDQYSYKTVTGFTVSEENRTKFGEGKRWFQIADNAELAEVMTDCLAYGYIMTTNEPTHQGKKGQTWTVYYLNYWLCAYAHLPLFRGGWRQKSLADIKRWLISEE